jgi:hypothetical protein
LRIGNDRVKLGAGSGCGFQAGQATRCLDGGRIVNTGQAAGREHLRR